MIKQFVRIFSTIILLLIFSGNLGAEDQKASYTSEQEYLFDIFTSRRSVRAYKPDAIPDEHIKKILDIARSAPTSGNQQPWKFLVVKNRKKLDELKNACIDRSLTRARMSGTLNEEQFKTREKSIRDYYEKTLSAPVYIVVLVNKQCKYPAYTKHDGPLAA
ncbi:MAG: nitroreductase family protein, partial [Candidatus Aminicenantes bacterium]|nr:nitroreductase family protein [Candidatus Aminicenantes bacterium]